MRSSRVRPERRGWEEVIYQQHVERIKKMSPMVDATPPRPHPLSNKRELDKRRKFMAIELDNKLLLERLAKVVQTKTIDNEIHSSVEMHSKFKKKMVANQKRMNMQRLTDENQRMLRRIQEVSPAYNHLEWEEDARKKEQIKRCMALYPEYYEREDRLRRTMSTQQLENEMSRLQMGERTGTPHMSELRNSNSRPQLQSSGGFSVSRSQAPSPTNKMGRTSSLPRIHG